MRMLIFPNCFWFTCLLLIVVTVGRKTVIMDKHWVCSVKTSCFECLKLSFCSWCQTENKCFSHKFRNFKGFCDNNTLEFTDYGFSIEDNAQCSCAGGKMEERCYSPGVTEGVECSGRGACVCGHCICDPTDDPTKMVMGEFCEFDNFSCDGPKCNEGPYSLSQINELDGYYKELNTDQSFNNNNTSM